MVISQGFLFLPKRSHWVRSLEWLSRTRTTHKREAPSAAAGEQAAQAAVRVPRVSQASPCDLRGHGHHLRSEA